jgi:hypothetical protein
MGEMKQVREPALAGDDPYAFRGTADLMRPHIRPDGEGGCLR